MKYIVQGNYKIFKVTLTQKNGEVVAPYIPTDADEVTICLICSPSFCMSDEGARRYKYNDFEQEDNVLTFADNGCLKVGSYALEVKIVESTTHRLRCMYREQIRVVASNDDIPTNADFEQDDIELQAEFEVAASVIVVDDELSETSENPVQNKVVTAAIKTKADGISVYESDGHVSYKIDLVSHFGNGVTTVSSAVLPYATQNVGGLMSASDKTKLDGIEAGANKTLFDNTPTEGSTKAVTSGGIEYALKHNVVNGVTYNIYDSGTKLKITVCDAYGNDLDEITEFPTATTSTLGLMSADDKTKLDGIATGATRVIVDSTFDTTSSNAISNSAVATALGDIDTILDNILGN